jgi:hypothetical protein
MSFKDVILEAYEDYDYVVAKGYIQPGDLTLKSKHIPLTALRKLEKLPEVRDICVEFVMDQRYPFRIAINEEKP